MSAKKYALGVDFGTQSGRAVLVEVATGREAACAVVEYADGVIDSHLPGGNRHLGVDWALQNPVDYLAVLYKGIPAVLAQAQADARDVIGIGVDFTSCTMLPVSADGRALCQLPAYRDNPHAWVKLWKHHAAQAEAGRMTEAAWRRQEDFLKFCGGKISAEWLLPKIWQVGNEAPEIYEAADSFLEAGDWIVWQLTGRMTRGSCAAGYKANWRKLGGYPAKDFFRALDSFLENLVEEKLRGEILPLGQKAGELMAEAAGRIGLLPGTPVATANIDAHAAVPATGTVTPGTMVMIMGTSTCHMTLSRELRVIDGVCGVVEDGIVPGFFGYEAGQVAVGDMFNWFAANGVPAEYYAAAQAQNRTIHQFLESKAAGFLPGESGLLALDWWNGVRTPLVDPDLSGLLLGLTLQTKPEEIYRALLEATAFGTMSILETFESAGLNIDRLVACGGLPEKNRLLNQMYADVTGRDIFIAATTQASALGAAMFGAVAAGRAGGGYDTITEAAAQMAGVKAVYRPDAKNVARYKALYAEYKTLQKHFGTGGNDVMKRLKQIKVSIQEGQ